MPAFLLIVLCVYALVSGVTFIAYALDKHAAGRGARRTPERTLHLMELAGGWPGAFLAQRTLRHKTRKTSYQVVFWAIVVLHAGGWVAAWVVGVG
ncbi:MAG: DUF1294 domain-containing protein [Phycisphaerales bacterium]